MVISITYLAQILICYCIGSVMSAIWVARWFKLPDPRSFGSKNPGATNMMRSANPKAAALTFILDIIKGVLTTQIALNSGYDIQHAYICGIAATLGHIFPAFHHFRGGKGVATHFGVVVTVYPVIGLIALCIWVVTLYLSKNSGLSAIVCAIITPLLVSLYSNHMILIITNTLMSILIIVSHHKNIYGLLSPRQQRVA